MPEQLSTEILNRGVQDSGPYAGSINFSIRVRRGLPDFLSSVNMKYVKLGYGYLLSHGFYLLMVMPIVVLMFGAGIGKIALGDFCPKFGIADACFGIGLLGLVVYIYFDSTTRSVYLVDFTCYRPPKELKISKEEFIDLAKKSGHFNDSAIDYQHKVLQSSGIGDETYVPRLVFTPGRKINLKDGREEASIQIFGAIDDLFASTNIKPHQIKILIVNCGVLNPTPSLSSMVINHYKLRHNIQSYNLGGMGCAAGIVAIDLAKDLLNVYRGAYALVVSTEVVSYTWYSGNDHSLLLPNCYFRMGAAAMLLSSRKIDRWRAKYELKQLVRTHKATDNRSYNSIQLKEDDQGKQGLSVSNDVIEIGGHALKANITTLGPLVLPVSEQYYFFKNLLFKTKSKLYIPDYKLAFEHICILASSKRVLDELEKNLELTEEYMKASRKTLERFGNTSSKKLFQANTDYNRTDRSSSDQLVSPIFILYKNRTVN
ncbi:hypothetical protein ACFE04_010550 [Oxalis oulophora]